MKAGGHHRPGGVHLASDFIVLDPAGGLEGDPRGLRLFAELGLERRLEGSKFVCVHLSFLRESGCPARKQRVDPSLLRR